MADARSVHKVSLLVAFLYLSKVHLMRMVYDYGGYILDITGPAMIVVQKITALAFSLHDGHARKEEELTDEQRKYAIRQKPTMVSNQHKHLTRKANHHIFHSVGIFCVLVLVSNTNGRTTCTLQRLYRFHHRRKL